MSDTYRDIVLASSPVAYYRLGDTSGTTATDSSGNSRNGTYVGGYTLNQSSLLDTDTNPSVDFDGTSGTVTITTGVIGGALNGASAVTLEAWFSNDDAPSTATQRIFGWQVDGGLTGGAVFFQSTNDIRAGGRSVKTDSFQSALASFSTTGSRTHVVAVFNYATDKIYIYVNGLDVTSGGTSVTFGNSTYTHGTATLVDSIGSYNSVNWFDGKIDEVAVYGTALSAATILLHYQAGLGQTTTASNTMSVSLATLNPATSPYFQNVSNTLSVAIEDFDPIAGVLALPDTMTVAIAEQNPTHKVSQTASNTITVAIADIDPARTYWTVPETAATKTVYTMTLTGDADATTDVVLPMASFQARARSAAQTYVSCIIPYTAAHAAAVAARPNGTMIVYGGIEFLDSGERQMTEILRADLTSIDSDTGPVNGSITLVGYADAASRPAATRTVAGVSYRRIGTPNQFRCNLIDFFLFPGDSAHDATSGQTITANLITYVISPGRQEMTISDGGSY